MARDQEARARVRVAEVRRESLVAAAGDSNPRDDVGAGEGIAYPVGLAELRGGAERERLALYSVVLLPEDTGLFDRGAVVVARVCTRVVDPAPARAADNGTCRYLAGRDGGRKEDVYP